MMSIKKLPLMLLGLTLAVGSALPSYSYADSTPPGETINGFKCYDQDESGTCDLGEPGLEGFKFTVTSLSTSYTADVFSAADGKFSFTGLAFGSYRVCETAVASVPAGTPPWVRDLTCRTVTLRGKGPGSVVFANVREVNQESGCALTQGYWKNHEEDVAALLGSSELQLGSNTYTAAELDAILETPPAGGNNLLQLSHQLIATLLNELNGANVSSISGTITTAQALIGASNLPGDVVTGNAAMVAAATILDNFNNGLLSVPHCEDRDEDDLLK
jgi:hypothetical protein